MPKTKAQLPKNKDAFDAKKDSENSFWNDMVTMNNLAISDETKNINQNMRAKKDKAKKIGNKKSYFNMIWGATKQLFTVKLRNLIPFLKKKDRYEVTENNHVGSIGQEVLKKKDDALTKADLSNGYYNPMKEMQRSDDELQNTFNTRVNEQLNLVSKNDFDSKTISESEKGYSFESFVESNYKDMKHEELLAAQKKAEAEGDKAKIIELEPMLGDFDDYWEHEGSKLSNFTSDEMMKLKEQYAQKNDASKELKPDFKVKDYDQYTPDSFALGLDVLPPPTNYIDYNRELADLTTKDVIKGALPFMKGQGRIKNAQEALNTTIKETRDYQEVTRRGKAEADKLGVQYDPNLDPNVTLLALNNAYGLKEEQGHSFVRLIEKKDENPIASYSFGFWPSTTIAGMGAKMEGVVKNPDDDVFDPSVIEAQYALSYSKYLEAVAKIRAIIGSRRSYSFFGYNCTSFAADIAKEVGVPIGKFDSGTGIPTFSSWSQLVESPYSLANYVRKCLEDSERTEATFFERGDKEIIEQIGTFLTKGTIPRADQTTDEKIGGVVEEYYKRLEKVPAYKLLKSINTTTDPKDFPGKILRIIVGNIKEVNQEIFNSLYIDSDTEGLMAINFSRDPMAEARSVMEKTREKKKEAFMGYGTATEFLKAAVTDNDCFYHALTLGLRGKENVELTLAMQNLYSDVFAQKGVANKPSSTIPKELREECMELIKENTRYIQYTKEHRQYTGQDDTYEHAGDIYDWAFENGYYQVDIDNLASEKLNDEQNLFETILIGMKFDAAVEKNAKENAEKEEGEKPVNLGEQLIAKAVKKICSDPTMFGEILKLTGDKELRFTGTYEKITKERFESVNKIAVFSLPNTAMDTLLKRFCKEILKYNDGETKEYGYGFSVLSNLAFKVINIDYKLRECFGNILEEVEDENDNVKEEINYPRVRKATSNFYDLLLTNYPNVRTLENEFNVADNGDAARKKIIKESEGMVKAEKEMQFNKKLNDLGFVGPATVAKAFAETTIKPLFFAEIKKEAENPDNKEIRREILNKKGRFPEFVAMFNLTPKSISKAVARAAVEDSEAKKAFEIFLREKGESSTKLMGLFKGLRKIMASTVEEKYKKMISE